MSSGNSCVLGCSNRVNARKPHRTPQGGIVSPFKANIYLDQLDKYMESHYLHLSQSTLPKTAAVGKC